ncbi:hypothetical protein HD554DRAFT_2040177 [Boletus coccyginus]|nr:hypothetical protein HD554DRAFT_2040177 [Boletus coccyginus]
MTSMMRIGLRLLAFLICGQGAGAVRHGEAEQTDKVSNGVVVDMDKPQMVPPWRKQRWRAMMGSLSGRMGDVKATVGSLGGLDAGCVEDDASHRSIMLAGKGAGTATRSAEHLKFPSF